MRILLLTNNLLYEQSMQDKLQILNYETLCSESLSKPEYLEELVRASQHFDLLIFSETVSEWGIERGMKRLEKTGIPILRKYSSEIKNSRIELLKESEEGTQEIENDCTLEELRELLSQYESRTQLNKNHREAVMTPLEKIHLVDLHLSIKEFQVMTILHDAGKEVVSRNKLIEQVWENEANNSTLAQISTIMKRIRNKAMKKGIPSNMIKTLWGRGYLLEDDVYDYIIFPSKKSEQKKIS